MAQATVVTVGTGWDSSKGGLSTFNRLLSLALVQEDVRVVMVVEDFDEGHAAGQIHLGLLQLQRGSRPGSYELENLKRVVDTTSQLINIDVSKIPLGFLDDGVVDTAGMRRASELVALTVEMRGAPAVVVFGRNDGTYRELATYRARRHRLFGLSLRRTQEQRDIFAGGGSYLYRWGEVGATPEWVRTTEDGADIGCWDAWSQAATREGCIESVEGGGSAWRGDRTLQTWTASTPTRLFLRTQEGQCLRIALHDGCVLVAGESGASSRNSRAINELAQATLPPDATREVEPPREVWPGRRKGAPCLVLPCGVEDGVLVLALLDPRTLELARAPVVSPYFVEECQLVDAGDRCLLIATLMRDCPAPLAVWDVTDDQEAMFATYGPEGRTGFCLASSHGTDGVRVCFTVSCHDGPDARQRTEVWSWSAGSSSAEKLFEVPGFVGALGLAG